MGAEKSKQLEEQATDTADWKKLIVFNDEINTFRYVIDTLIKVCKHRPEQAEQCTWIIHYTGRCIVKEGSFKDLQRMRTAISGAGIKSEIR